MAAWRKMPFQTCLIEGGPADKNTRLLSTTQGLLWLNVALLVTGALSSLYFCQRYPENLSPIANSSLSVLRNLGQVELEKINCLPMSVTEAESA
eukprot:1160311-Pelagomonas_calceolata.AAC.7